MTSNRQKHATILFVIAVAGVLCNMNKKLFEPLVKKDGDFIIVGSFEIGILVNEECRLTKSSVYPLEKALVFQDLMENFAVGNYTIGYEIYSGCDEQFLAQQISSKVALNEKVVGLIASDSKDNVQPSIGPPTSFYIPTLGYIYSEDSFLRKERYPTYLSLTETEEMEAQSVINLLKFLRVQYVDVWYNLKSETAARFVYDHFVLQAGGGRFIQFIGNDDNGISNEFAEYDSFSKVPPAPVQLLLFNGNIVQVIPFLKETIVKRKWRNKTYIFGYTVSRDHYRDVQQDILRSEPDTEREIFVYLRSDLQNADREKLKVEGGVLYERAKAGTDRLSQDYRETRMCNFSEPEGDLAKDCDNKKPFTSWMGYVATATMLLKNNLEKLLEQKNWGLVDIFELRKSLFESLESGKHSVEIYGDFLGNLTFERSTLAMGFEVIEYRKDSSEIKRGRVYFNQSVDAVSTALDLTLRDHVLELGGGGPCSTNCSEGSHVVLMSSSPGLSQCWTCHECTDNTISWRVNSKQCTKCAVNEFAIDNNTQCRPVPINFISLWSVQFAVGFIFSSLAGVFKMITAVFIMVHKNRPVVKASDPVFCYLFLFSLFLGDLLTVAALFEPSTSVCHTEFYICTLFVSSVCTNLFYRSLKIYKIFKTAMELQLKRPFIFKCLSRGAQMVFLATALVVTTLLTMAAIISGGWVYEDSLHPHKSLDKLCTSSNFAATCLPFMAPCLMLVTTLIIAYKMRLFPHNFKETTTIFTTCMMLVVICLIFLSGYSISEASTKSVLRAIVYFCISQTFLFCIFFPKILVILKNEDLIDTVGALSSTVQNFSYCKGDSSNRSELAHKQSKKRGVYRKIVSAQEGDTKSSVLNSEPGIGPPSTAISAI